MRPLPFFTILTLLMIYMIVWPNRTQTVIIEPNNRSTALRSNFSDPVYNSDALRHELLLFALEQLHKPYVLGTEGPQSFDCSGLVQYVYAQVGIDTTRTTFTQLDHLTPIQSYQLKTADLMYFQYPWDQHVGIVADINNDGSWDMLHAAAPGLGVMIDYDVFNIPFYTNAIIGYRSAL